MSRRIVCVHCGAEVFWAFPRPDDPCYQCEKPIALRTPDDDASKAVDRAVRRLPDARQ